MAFHGGFEGFGVAGPVDVDDVAVEVDSVGGELDGWAGFVPHIDEDGADGVFALVSARLAAEGFGEAGVVGK